jgi:hypothetical protein
MWACKADGSFGVNHRDWSHLGAMTHGVEMLGNGDCTETTGFRSVLSGAFRRATRGLRDGTSARRGQIDGTGSIITWKLFNREPLVN